MDEQEPRRVHNANTGDPGLLIQTGQTGDVQVQNAHASGNADIYQSGRDQYIETHLYFGVGARHTRRVESDAMAEVDPYPKGMAAFGPEDAEWFFGRDRLLADLLGLVDERFRAGGEPLMVMAPSGAGKSSLLHAGLIPKLEQGAIPGSQHWPGLRITPTARPIKALGEAIAVITGKPAADVEREITEQPDCCLEALGAVVRARSSTAIPANARLIVIVDQLEELFTLCTDDQERRCFLDLLSRLCTPGAAGGEPVALVVYGMRADFYAHCAAYPELSDSVQHGHVVVGPMTPDELREAILNPAQRAGLRVEPGLVELLLADLGALTGDSGADLRPGGYEAGRLPLLAHALRATYLGRHGRSLSVEAYRLTGGIENAVATTADQAYDRLDPAAREAARALFLRLIKIGDGGEHTRRRVPRTELLGDGTDQAVTAALDTFTSKRLLTQGLDHDTVEITHEALIHAWPLLQGWINEDRAGNLIRQQLTEAATAWENEGHDRAALYRGARLATAREHTSTRPDNDNLSATARNFLRASTHNENRAARRRNMAVVSLSLLTVLSLIAVYVANAQRNVATAKQLTAQADQVLQGGPAGADASLAAQLNLAAYQLNANDDSIETKLFDASNEPLSSPPITLGEPVDSMAFSADGRTLAGRDDSGVRLWDVSVPGQALSTGNPSPGKESFNPDRRTVASSSDSETWSVPGQPFPLGESLTGHGPVSVFSPDGRTLARGGEGDGEALSGGPDGAVQLWDVSLPGKALPLGEPLIDHSDVIDSMAFSPDGRTLASGNREGTVQLWDVSVPGKALPLGDPLTGHSGFVNSLAFSADGRTLASGGDDGVRLWDVMVPGKSLPLGESLTSNSGPVSSLAFSPDGRTLAIGGRAKNGGEIRLWDIPDAPDHRLLKDSSDFSVTFGADGQTLASDSGRSWEAAVPDFVDEPMDSGTGSIYSMALSPDGRTLVNGSWAGGVRLWDMSIPGKEMPLGEPLLHYSPVFSVAFSPDGQMLASGGLQEAVRLWDISDRGKVVELPLGRDLDEYYSPVFSVAFSPDGNTLASGSEDGTVRLWDVSDPGKASQLGEPLVDHSEPVESLAFSPDGQTLASGNRDGVVQLWDVSVPGRASRLGKSLPSHSGSVESLAFSPDSQTLVSGSEDGTVRLWDVSDPGKASQLGEPLADHSEPVFFVAFSADGQKLASSSNGKTVRQHDLNIERVIDRTCNATRGYLTPDLWNRYFPGEEPIESPCLK